MRLQIASPLRRGTRIHFRNAVPKDLQKILGKAEIKISLRTTDEWRRGPSTPVSKLSGNPASNPCGRDTAHSPTGTRPRSPAVNVLDVIPVGQSLGRFIQAELPATTRQPFSLPLLSSYGFSSVEAVEALDAQSCAVAQLVSDRVLADAQTVAEAARDQGREHGFRSEGTGAADRRGYRAAGTDLVVVGRRGLSGLTELVVGSDRRRCCTMPTCWPSPSR